MVRKVLMSVILFTVFIYLIREPLSIQTQPPRGVHSILVLVLIISYKCSNSLCLVNLSYISLACSHMHHLDLGLLALEN